MKTLGRVSLAVLFLTWGLNAMAASNNKHVISASNAVVTLDVFSGRPNPTWSLPESTTVELLRRLQALEESKVDALEFDGLGYRGVSAEFHDQSKGVIDVKASRGFVTLNQSGQRFRYVDPGRQFELWLVNTGAGHLTPDLLQYVTKEIVSKPQ
ncbi:MAG TPA: hypothetical protein VNO18_05480 [Xanthobacteraceae bacterium]|jgi:hypothetical protein|nr:hypothetical protein [Xanthobacteraceae bacterium]